MPEQLAPYVQWIERILGFLQLYPIVWYVLITILMFVLASIVSRITYKVLNRYIIKSSSALNVDPTGFNFFKNGLRLIIYLTAAILLFYIIPPLNSFAQTLTVGATVIAAVAAFASQHALANVVGGLFIVIFKPFRVGDIIQVGTLQIGKVEDITLRHTVINSLENRRIVIPNAVINNETIINSSISDEKTCMFVEVGIAYAADAEKAMKLMQQVCEADPDTLDNRTEEDLQKGIEKVEMRLIALADSAQVLRAYVWAQDPVKGLHLRFRLLLGIKKVFDEHKIEIPFPHRTVYLRQEKNSYELPEASNAANELD